jgi:two-component system LytT family response regulator
MDSRIKALIVDDEPLARTAMATLLAEHGQVDIIGMAGGVKEARALLVVQAPDVVFLDMEMPGGSGLELESFLPTSTRAIFVTAFADYALQAFEFGASDYLVKPVDSQRLEIALERLLRQLPRLQDAAADNYLSIEAEGKVNRVRAAEILWIRAQQNYSEMRIKGRASSLIVPKSMANWESELPAESFDRLGRSLIVNVMRIQMVSWLSRDETLIEFQDDTQPLRLGRSAARRLKVRLREGK